MPTLEDIQRYFFGTWRMMTGRADGVSLLDISEDGFWNSFYAMIVAIPPLLIGWVGLANDLIEIDEQIGSRFGIVVRAAIVDALSWVVPLLVIGLLAHQLGISRRFVHYVVASNWGSALISWLLLPTSLLRLFLPDHTDLNAIVGLLSFGLVLALSYRLTQLALQKPHAIAAPIYAGIVIGSLFLTIILQNLLGIGYSVAVSS